MAVKSFDEFVRRENQAAQLMDQEGADWQARKAYWLSQLEQLFAHIREYLEPYLTRDQVRIDERTIHMNEEYVGSYSAPEMLITIGSKTIRLEPIGANVLLAKGRVDVEGPLARSRLLLLDSDSPFMRKRKDSFLPWKILTRPPLSTADGLPDVGLTGNAGFRLENAQLMNKSNFLKLLQEVASG